MDAMTTPERRCVGVVVHHERPEAADLARGLSEWLVSSGHDVRIPAEDAAVAGLSRHGVDAEAFTDGGARATLDAVVSLGGDGTILRTVNLLAGSSIPVIGVNLGHLGYLAEIEPHEVRSAIGAVLSGRFAFDDRMLLEVTVERAAPSGEPRVSSHALALNEAVLERRSNGHMVRLDVDLAGQSFTPYEADALIVATPTGSTAYAFSARGPIIEPIHRAILLTPVSPHMLFDRSLVLDPSTTVRVTVAGHRAAMLTVDGRVIDELPPGSSVSLAASERVARLVRTRPRHFHSILKAKFGLNDR